jgi:hypothetical protein
MRNAFLTELRKSTEETSLLPRRSELDTGQRYTLHHKFKWLWSPSDGHGGSFLGDKAARAWGWAVPFTANLKKACCHISIFLSVFMALEQIFELEDAPTSEICCWVAGASLSDSNVYIALSSSGSYYSLSATRDEKQNRHT